jgi:ArsR family transcriptional regulator
LLTDVSRLRVLNLLYEEELCVCEIQEVLNLTQVTVSKRLAQLKEANLVEATKSKNRVFYSINERNQQAEWLFNVIMSIRNTEEVLVNDIEKLKEHDIIKGDKEYICPNS